MRAPLPIAIAALTLSVGHVTAILVRTELRRRRSVERELALSRFEARENARLATETLEVGR